MKKSKQITKNMLIGDIVTNYPELVQTMLEHGMHCIGCHVATWETLEQAALGHGIDVDKFIREMNNKIKS